MRRKTVILCIIVAIPILYFVSTNARDGGKYSETRLKGLNRGEVVKLLGTPQYAGSRGRITTVATELELNFYFIYLNGRGNRVQIFFEDGKVVKVQTLPK
jgi:hypothetical protein